MTQVSPRKPAKGTRCSVENLNPSSTTLEGRSLPAVQLSPSQPACKTPFQRLHTCINMQSGPPHKSEQTCDAGVTW